MEQGRGGASARRRRRLTRWSVPFLALTVGALLTKLASELVGEPESLEWLSLALAAALGAYAVMSILLYILIGAVWAPIAHALGVNQGACPWCGLTTDTRDPKCRHCRRPLLGGAWGEREIWLCDCPLHCQGQVNPLVADGGLIVLMCDECGAVWCVPDEVNDVTWSDPQAPDWLTHCGVAVDPEYTRFASRADLPADEPWSSVDWIDVE